MTRLISKPVIRQFAASLNGSSPPYWSERFQIELSIRLNVISNLAAAFNEAELANLSFCDGSGFPQDSSRADIIGAFNASIARDARLFHDRIFRLFDMLEPARDPIHLDADLGIEETSGCLDRPLHHADIFRVELDSALQLVAKTDRG